MRRAITEMAETRGAAGPINSRGDALIVRAEPLGYYLRVWKRKYLAEHPSQKDDSQVHGRKGQHLTHFGAINWLAQESGIDKSEVGKICNGYFAHVSLSKADRLLTTIGMSFLLFNEIEVIPSPNWSIQSWVGFMANRGIHVNEDIGIEFSTPPCGKILKL